MKRLIAEWLWRMALLGLLGWIGWELHGVRADMNQPTDEQTAAATGPDEVQDRLEAIRDDLEVLNQKVDAIMVVMARAK
jgi:hypothetical protein